MKLARDIMNSPVVSIPDDATVGQAARLMLDKGYSALPVVNQKGKVVGIITHTDFGLHERRLPMTEEPLYTLLGAWATPGNMDEVAAMIRSRPVKDVMSKPVVAVQESAPIGEVASLMLRNKVRRLPVLRGESLVGIIASHDFLKLVADPVRKP
ncbi:MAG: CBS domain-containing protein [Chloroflexi bacterium]|nr:CBS domain-containing protein [Chloroflexota bacterium]